MSVRQSAELLRIGKGVVLDDKGEVVPQRRRLRREHRLELRRSHDEQQPLVHRGRTLHKADHLSGAHLCRDQLHCERPQRSATRPVPRCCLRKELLAHAHHTLRPP